MGCSTSAPLQYDYTSAASVEFAPADPATQSGAIRRNPKFKEELIRTCYPQGFNTLYEGFQRGLRISKVAPCMGTRAVSKGADGADVYGAYEWKTYEEVADLRDAIGSSMMTMNLLPPLGEEPAPLRLTAIFSKNREEWVLVEQACNAYGGVSVPLYDTLGIDAVAFVLQQTGIPTVWADRSSAATVMSARETHAESMAAVTAIVQFEAPTEAEVKRAADVGITLHGLDAVIEAGRANLLPHTPPKPDDIATFCYTSGTTGDPKGAMLTHANIIADASAAIMVGLAIVSTDVHISYLPLAHMFERVVQVALWCHGSRIGFYTGSPLRLMDDIKALSPTLFPSVPRLFNKIYDKIMAGVTAGGGLKAKLFRKAFAVKRENLKKNILTSKFWDGKVFSKVRARLGMPNVRMLVTGSAPIAPHVMEFLKIVFGAPVFEGYGQTECAAAGTLTDPNDAASSGHVGAPLPCNEIKLVSVADMDYLVEDRLHGHKEEGGKVVAQGVPCLGRGEVCFRGPNVFVGYYKNDAKTAEALDADGWLHSGDIGIWTDKGNLRIVDRKKNIFKLSQGEYVAPEKIENVYARSAFVAQSFVHGDSLQSELVGVIVPDEDHLKTYCPAAGIAGATMAEWVASAALKKAILDDLRTVGKESGLKGFELVRDIYLEAKPFSAENNLLTPTFKLRRVQAREVYTTQIDAMYAARGGTTAGLKQGAVDVAEVKVEEAAKAVDEAKAVAESKEEEATKAAAAAGGPDAMAAAKAAVGDARKGDVGGAVANAGVAARAL